MTINNITQPDFITISDELRLRKFDGKYEFTFDWYQDENTLILVDGLDAVKYDMDKLHRMYNYLNNKGELYFIEVKEAEVFKTIGDITFWQEDMPIVIGDNKYRGKGIGKQVVEALIKRAKELGYKEIFVNEIYTYNLASQHLFESVGFSKYKETEYGFKYKLDITGL